MTEEEKIPEQNFKEDEVSENISLPQAIEQPETQNINLETENMEVHHHPNVEKKNFKEYLLEGLMIFLAVTLGFFAESYREHITEEKNAKQFLETYRNELQQQEQQIMSFEDRFKNKLIVCDSIVQIYNN